MAEMVDRREGHARGDGRRADALPRSRACGDNLAARRRRRDRAGAAATSRTCRRSWRQPPPTLPPPRAGRAADRGRRARAREPGRSTCTTSSTALVDDGHLLRDQAAVRAPSWSSASRGSTARPSASSPTTRRVKGGVLFVDSADKAARFIWLCDAFNVPLRVPRRRAGLHDRHRGRAQGIIRHGAKMITAVAEATVPKICVDRAQGVRRRALRDGRPGVRPRRHASRCRPRRSR